ncbi:cytochrome c oxidase subunit 3 [Luteimonas sp. BDR2-5]|uniref:cytochrome c oxidase subunit 3 n=1 Tax=Proluteimonas luteida TaxID=2878685 RepID=UPI001E4170D1|nr:cytochrome c oxidase subunit 3 [Luteimonas sp. BDR2-5]MCD9029148.1 cytochrome c oxidase subunit 3 [Luteimonas sp. BDR2-5]
MNEAVLHTDTRAHPARRVPGEPGLWVFLFADMAIFLVFFVAFLKERGQAHELFEASRMSVGLTIGLINTVILLTSSLLVVMGINAARHHANEVARRALYGAVACGVVFVVLKLVEYTHLIQAGHVIGSNLYFDYFYFLTGMHLAHILIGFVTLSIMIGKVRQPGKLSARDMSVMESCGCYWHLVDLLWMFIFPLLIVVA